MPTAPPTIAHRLLVVWIAFIVAVSVVATGRDQGDRAQEVSTAQAVTLPSLPEVTLPTLPDVTIPEVTLPPVTLPPVTVPALPPLPSPVQEVVEQIACVGDGTVPLTHDGLWLVDADRGCARVVMRGLQPGTPTFSPDGRTAIVPARDSDEPFASTTLWRVDLTTGLRQALVPAALGLGKATWSPDGGWIAYTTFPTEPPLDNPTASPGPRGSSEVWLVRPDGRDAHRISSIDGWGLMAWSPDGGELAVTLKNDDHVLIYDVGAGTERRFPVPAPYLATWSPDGRELLIDGDVPGAENDSTTYRMDARTGATTRWGEHTWFPRWSPDGELVATYLGFHFGDRVRLHRPDGTVVAELPPELPLNWSSDSRYLLMAGGSVYDRATGAVRQITVPGGGPGPWPRASRWIPGTHTFAAVATESEHYTP